MAVQSPNSLIKAIRGSEKVIGEDLSYDLEFLLDDISAESASEAEATQKFLQKIHDEYGEQLKDKSPLKDVVTDAQQKGTIASTPVSVKATEELLGEEQPQYMFTRFPSSDLSKALGIDEKELLTWDSDKHWTKIPTGDMMSLLQKSGLDFNAALKSLSELQEIRDKEMVAEGRDVATGKVKALPFMASALQGVFTPRVKEAIKMGRDPSGKDYALDIGANAIQAVPVGRLAGLATRSVAPFARKVATSTAQAVVPPLAEEVADASMYNELENPNRANFNAGRVALGAGVNLGTPLAIGGAAGRMARYDNNRGAAARVRDALMGDSYLDFLDRQQGIGSTVFGGQNLRNEMDEAIMADIMKVIDKADLKKMSKEQLASYADFLSRHPEIAEKRNDILAAYWENIGGENPELDRRIRQIFNKDNPGTVTPTSALAEEGERFGLDAEGNLAYVNKTAAYPDKQTTEVKALENLGKEHNLPIGVTQTSAVDMRNQAFEQTKALKGDFGYPARPTKFDLKVQEFMDNPEFMRKVRSRDVKYNLGLTSGLNLATNKAGRESYAAGLITPEQAEDLNVITGGVPKSVREILADPTIIRQWDAGFKPRETDREMMEAYRLYKKAKEEQDRQNASGEIDWHGASSPSQGYQPSASSRAGSKAGL